MLYPIGIQNLENIRQSGYVYVDKTDLVHRLVTTGKYYFLSRPRRFGKSLLVSTLEAYFQGKKESFSGLAIGNLEKDWNSYPILSGFERQDVQQSRGFGNDLGPASEPMGKDCVGEGGRIRCRFLAFFKKNVPLLFMLGFLPRIPWQEAQHSLASKTKTLKINRNYEFP